MRKTILSLDKEGSRGLEFLADQFADKDELDNEYRRMQKVLRNIMSSNSMLTDRQREVLQLRFFDGMSVTDIAATLGITPPTASKHIKIACQRIQTVMLLSFPRLQLHESDKIECRKSARGLEKKSQFTFYGLTTPAIA